jgi:hypothetical protein
MSSPNQSRLFDRWGLPAKQVEPQPPSPAKAVFRNGAPNFAKGDPSSSRLTGIAIRTSGVEASQAGAIVAWMRANAREPLTSLEISIYGGFRRSDTGRHMKTLERRGDVVRCEKRRCREGHWTAGHGIRCDTWLAVDGAAPRSQVPPGAVPPPRQEVAETPAAGSALVQTICARCAGAGIIRVDQSPDVYQWCDYAAGEGCDAAERLRATNPREVEQSNAAALKTYKLSSTASGVLAR